MGDMREAWDDWKEVKKWERDLKMPARIKAIEALAGSGHTVKVLQEGTHYRIDGRLDLYPVHQRYHDIRRQKRGWYRTPEECVRKTAAATAHGGRS